MTRTLAQHLDPAEGPKRILGLDGGGVKGVLTLGMLQALETELRRRSGDPKLVLSDYYDLIGGTSTGAIVATGLALGKSVDEMIQLYMKLGPKVFGRRIGDGNLFRSKYDPRDLRRALEPTLGKLTLGAPEVKTGLAIHMKRIDTGSAWVLTNNPRNPYYSIEEEDRGTIANKEYRLIDLVMASAAAPTFFDEVVIDIAAGADDRIVQRGYFVDGAVGANNNPSIQLLLLALIPAYGFSWGSGADRLMLTSVGTGQRRPEIDGDKFQRMAPGFRGIQALRSMIYDTQIQGIMMMQALSEPRKPWRVNSEVKDMRGERLTGGPLLDFQRIDVMLDLKPKAKRGEKAARSMVETLLDQDLSAKDLLALDELANGKPKNMNYLMELGMAAGKAFVGPDYPDPKFNLPGWSA